MDPTRLVPDGTELAVAGYVDGWNALLVADTLGQNGRVLAKGLGYLSTPKWSPQGSRIAFVGRVGNSSDNELWTVGRDGTNLRQVTTDGAVGGIAWSPSGHEIIYIRYQSLDLTCTGGVYANGTLWRLDPLTGERHQLTSNTEVECP